MLSHCVYEPIAGNPTKGYRLHFNWFHCALYPTHLLPIHLFPRSTAHAVCRVYSSGSASVKVLCQKIAEPFSGNTDIPAYGHTVASPIKTILIYRYLSLIFMDVAKHHIGDTDFSMLVNYVMLQSNFTFRHIYLLHAV